MNLLDVICLLIVILFATRGTIRGFVKEFSTMAALILGILVAVLFSGVLASVIDQYLSPTFWNQVIAFLILFIITYIIVKFFEMGLRTIVERTHLENLDRAIGFFLGLVEAILIIFILLFIMHVQQFIDFGTFLADSFFNKTLTPFFPYATILMDQISEGATDV